MSGKTESAEEKEIMNSLLDDDILHDDFFNDSYHGNEMSSVHSMETFEMDGCSSRNQSMTSSLMESIMSGAIESIAMQSLSIGPTTTVQNEGSVDIQSCLVYKGESTSVYRIEDPMNKSGGRTGALAIKVISDPYPDEDQISRMNRERDMSKKLSGHCKAVRSVLETFSGAEDNEIAQASNVLFLEWVPGITARAWAQEQPRQSGSKDGSSHNLENRVNVETTILLACEIAKSLAGVHEVGKAVVGNLCTENIIVNDVGQFSVNIIGLGSASFLPEVSPKAKSKCANKSIRSIRNDLQSLGEVFFELFSGQSPHKGASNNSVPRSEENANSIIHIALCNDDSMKNKQRSLRELRSILFSLSIPPRIITLILDLMQSTQNTASVTHYDSATAVRDELYQILAELDRFMFEMDLNIGWLQFTPGKLYGHKQQQLELSNVRQRSITIDEGQEVVLVSGFSGSGKTLLVKKVLQEPLLGGEGGFLHIKFDQLHQGEPLRAIIIAFNEYFYELVDGCSSSGILSKTRASIQEMIVPELLGLLSGFLPSLSKIIGTQPQNDHIKVEGLMALNQFKFAFQMLFRAVSNPANPIVMFLDDLQWADAASLELVETLILDSQNKSVVFIECFRDNEINNGHPFTSHLHKCKESGVLHTEIKVDNLTKDDVNELVSDVLHEPQSKTASLADIVYRKTGGNVLLVIQFVESLWDEGLLHYSFRLRSWQWQTSLIDSKIMLNGAADLMARRILCLPANTQHILMTIACLGSQCEESTVLMIESKEMVRMLDVAVDEGFVDKVGTKYKFAHDQIQDAAYSLIPENTRQHLHFQIGKRFLLHLCHAEGLESMLFLTVDQLNRGNACVKEESMKIDLARLNCRAGGKALSSAAFTSAESYLKLGMSLLDEGHWKEQYELCLQLYLSHANAAYCSGDFEGMKTTLDCIHAHVACLDDKLQAYSVHVNALVTQHKNFDAMEVGLNILKCLGVTFPSDPGEEKIIHKEYLKTKKALQGSAFAQVASKTIVDKRMLFIMELLEMVSVTAYYTNQGLQALIICRMILLSLRHGICESTPIAFSMYSQMLCGPFDDIKGGSSYGQLALDILDHLNAQHKLSRVYISLYNAVFVWSKPLKKCVEPQLKGYNVGMKSGDITFATTLCLGYCMISFQCGKALTTVASSVEQFEKNLIYKQSPMWQASLPFKKALMQLMGRRDDGTVVTYDKMLSDAVKNNDRQQVCRIYYYQMLLAYLFGNYETAAVFSGKINDIMFLLPGKFEMLEHTFYSGLICISLSKKSKEDKSLPSLIEKAIDKMRSWAEQIPCNCKHKLLLLEAEFASLKGDGEAARCNYSSAADLAKKNDFIQDQALAYERAGMYYFEKGEEAKAAEHYRKAYVTYLEWGAQGKADHLCECYPF